MHPVFTWLVNGTGFPTLPVVPQIICVTATGIQQTRCAITKNSVFIELVLWFWIHGDRNGVAGETTGIGGFQLISAAGCYGNRWRNSTGIPQISYISRLWR